MSTFLFAPGLRVTIATRLGVLDVSEDVARGEVELNLGRNNGHRMNLVLTNDRQKYAGVFTPNDRFSVHMKRIRWVQVMSGYLDSVPIFSGYSEDVAIAGQCTLKRAKFSVYDKGSQAVANLLNFGYGSGGEPGNPAGSVDSDLGRLATTVLTELVHWPKDQIHMGDVPVNWMAEIHALYETLEEQGVFTAPPSASGIVSGISLSSYGSAAIRNPDGSVDSGPGYGILPQTNGSIGPMAPGTRFSLSSGEATENSSTHSTGDWVCAMRWPYEQPGVLPYQPGYLDQSKKVRAQAWWRARRMLLVNSRTQKAIVVRPVHWGPPANSGHAVQVPRNALLALGASTGDHVEIRFAPPDAPFGPFTAPAGATSSAGAGADSQGALVGLFGGTHSTATGVPTLSHDGLLWNSRERMSGNTAAARDFVFQNWGKGPGRVLSIGGYRDTGSVSNSDHPKGLAIDVMVTDGSEPTNEQVALGNSIAYWFCQNPGAFGTKYVIWNNMIYTEGKSKPYVRSDRGESGVTLGHRDHVHISFHNTGQTSIGPRGTPFPASPSDFYTVAATNGVHPHGNQAAAIGGPGSVGGGGFGQLITAWNWYREGDPHSEALVGARMLLNDEPVKPLLDQMMSAAQRDYCSAPNGDFIAWFPDYFNLYGTLSRMVLQTIEISKFNIQWNDNNLITHQFVTGGSIGGLNAPTAQIAFQERQAMTHGIATVEQPELLSTLLNASKTDIASAGWIDPKAILARFGARINHDSLDWAATPEAEFWAAVKAFRLSWANQFSAQINVSFLPEIFPGMIVQIPEFGIQFYVDRVSHSFSLGPDGRGFSTSINVTAPSTIGARAGLYGLPRGGHWVGAQEQGPAYGPVLDKAPGAPSSTQGATPPPSGGGRMVPW